MKNGKKTLEALSARLMLEYGTGYDARNLRYMRSTVMPSDEILRREIETQKELYRLQMMDEESSSMSKRLKKKGKAK